MTGQSVHHLVANRWAEPLRADDAEILGLWSRAAESFEDAAAPGLSPTGCFKLLYDAARQGVVAFAAAHGYRALGAGNHHQHAFALGATLAPEPLRSPIAALQVQRGVRHDLEYGARRTVSPAQVDAFRADVLALLASLAEETRGVRPGLAPQLPRFTCAP
jgi:hypothetical protein